VVLGGYPPPVKAEEADLPRVTRCRLAQLRSGYCKLLNSYNHLLDPETAAQTAMVHLILP